MVADAMGSEIYYNPAEVPAYTYMVQGYKGTRVQTLIIASLLEGRSTQLS